MSLGSWDPNIDTAKDSLLLEPALLQRLMNCDREDQLAQLDQFLTADEKQQFAGLMKIDHSVWLSTADTLSEDDLKHLIRFFAVAENLPGWEAGPASPVIPLAKTLRQRGTRLDKSLLQWLREVNDNRFLPYGPL